MQYAAAAEDVAVDIMVGKMEKAADQSKLTMGYMLAFVIGVIGGGVGGYIGWLLEDGHAVIFSAVMGFVICFSLTFCVAGPLRHHWSRITGAGQYDAFRFGTLGIASSFDLYVTVHRVKNLYAGDAFFGLLSTARCNYFEVSVGRFMQDDRVLSVQNNPVKRTCVTSSGVFEECLHFVVSPTDDTIRFTLYDQEVFKDAVVGHCEININDEVLASGFPQQIAVNLQRPIVDTGLQDTGALAGTLIVSFAPGSDFPLSRVEKRSGLAVKRLRDVQTDLVTKSRSAGNYGTWATSAY
mmetsp:Transcript_81434/g.143796  ORF Transcript_81434/g.143796 Transcript_81434/m.143796 type:complete len:295 (-) Transcript_81434:108-992(-)